ncbi:MAG TPA: 4-(cytidine 5'-diphospho)-2-C-methyl-D-erythritol kinase [Lentimicrobium sp.]|nr:4-(cytidine 5'-diphospho)-2-C-methyl-D-erythritol kinase [Lentimicrobium sp.]
MIAFPNAKINLGLRILRKRGDGYHDIQTYMVPVSMCDALEIVPSNEGFAYTGSGILVDGSEDSNLCVKAYRLYEKYYKVNTVKIHLHKIIPMGAGLGGGSSNGAFTLTLLRKLNNLKLCNAELEGMAALLGSDCPFFILNRPQLIEQTGVPTHKYLHIPQYHVVIVVPDIHINTAWAYSIIKPSGVNIPDQEMLLNKEDNWPELLYNDFEEPVFSHFPVLSEIKKELYDAGAFYASMTGSGSAIYGLFKNKPEVTGRFNDHFVWVGKTLC